MLTVFRRWPIPVSGDPVAQLIYPVISARNSSADTAVVDSINNFAKRMRLTIFTDEVTARTAIGFVSYVSI